MQKSKIGSAFAINFKVFYPIVTLVVLVIIIIWISDRTRSCQGYGAAPLSSARGIGAAISATIQAKHSDYLINGDKYTLDDVLASTSFTGGITYTTTPNNTPAMREICSNVSGDRICVNPYGEQYDWNWTPRVSKTPALITENPTSAFP